jgi:hypothetical protein
MTSEEQQRQIREYRAYFLEQILSIAGQQDAWGRLGGSCLRQLHARLDKIPENDIDEGGDSGIRSNLWLRLWRPHNTLQAFGLHTPEESHRDTTLRAFAHNRSSEEVSEQEARGFLRNYIAEFEDIAPKEAEAARSRSVFGRGRKP